MPALDSAALLTSEITMDDSKSNPDETEGTTRGSSQSKKSTKSGKARLTNHQWGELIALLKTGHFTQKELSLKFGVSVGSILQKRKKLGGVKIGEASTAKTTLAAIDKTVMAMEGAIGFSTVEAGRLITEAKRETFRRGELIGKLTEHAMTKAFRDGNVDSIKDTVKVLLDCQALFEKQLRMTGLCLGFENGKFDTAADAPVLTIIKMTDEDIANVQSSMRDDANEDDYIEDDYIEDDYEEGDEDDYEEIE